jgi:hypothetical protein
VLSGAQPPEGRTANYGEIIPSGTTAHSTVTDFAKFRG